MSKSHIPQRLRRKNTEIRSCEFLFNLGHHADGNCLARFGNTLVLCTARIEQRVPPHIRGTGAGWLTAEYAMLPNATNQRINRAKSFEGGRSKEISRLIGRSLRAVCNFTMLGERQIIIDCDVLHADGGTRTTAINGSFIALYRALQTINKHDSVLVGNVAAISCVLMGNDIRVDPDYQEDSTADTDANFVLTGNGGLIEAQATAENRPMSVHNLSNMLGIAQTACQQISRYQAVALKLEESHFLENE